MSDTDTDTEPEPVQLALLPFMCGAVHRSGARCNDRLGHSGAHISSDYELMWRPLPVETLHTCHRTRLVSSQGCHRTWQP